MNDMTQEGIRKIAQDLLARAVGAPGPIDLPQAAQGVDGGRIPTVPPQANPDSFGASALPLNAVPLSAAGFPPSIPSPMNPQVPSLAQFGQYPPMTGSFPGIGLNPFSVSQLPPSQPSPPNPNSMGQGGSADAGIKAFVRQVRESTFRTGFGPCGQNPDHQRIASLFQVGKQFQESGSSRPLDIPSIRKDFPILNQKVHGKQLVWLDNAATTQKPQSVIDALSYYYSHDNSNIHRAAHTLAARSTDAYEGARQKIQRFLGASSVNEVIFVRGTTEGINLVANTFGRKFFGPGDEILLSLLEHHANIVPWQMIARETGAVIKVIPVNDHGEINMSEYQALLGPRTKLVSITHASNSLGTIFPIEDMTRLAKRYGAHVLIDGAQSVAHIPVNFQELGCDFFVFSGHKIFGPTGIGAVLIKEELQHLLPPWQGGGNMIKRVTFEETTYSEPPAKFEAGTPNIADAVGLGAALDYVSRLGLSNIGKYEHELLGYATEKLKRVPGLRLIGTAHEKVGVMSFVLKDRRTQDVGKWLDQEGIAVRSGHHCAQPSLRRFGVEETVRPSLSFYNTFEEMDRLYEALIRLQQSSPRHF